ncbi:hypothetical protein EB796_006432 [Bugula neritina]|uniref:FH2 domain-containing protein n=1 Tax=Bugula neritina TaxID=10212 RepID=A0A7J7KBF3_BUGNE|nr:hypothetical protein EB796_006432 [Bugula neritina]
MIANEYRYHMTQTVAQLITLLDPKKSMNVNIFMKQFKMPNSEVVEKIKLGDYELIGQEKLLGLLKILPASDEGKYSGDAQGFKISSLLKLVDTKANRARVTLLHYIVEEIVGQDQNVLDFVQHLGPILKAISRISLDQQEVEIRQIKGKVEAIEKRISNSNPEVKEQYSSYITSVTEQIQELLSLYSSVKSDSEKMAEFFCEEVKKFDVDEFFGNLNTFLEKVIQCKKDNEQRKIQEERALKRKQAQEAEMARRKSLDPSGSSGTPKNSLQRVKENDVCLVDLLLNEIRQGTSLKTRKMPRSVATIS